MPILLITFRWFAFILFVLLYSYLYIDRKMLIANNFSTATVFDFVLQALFSCFSISKSGQQANPVGNRDRKSPNKLYAINVDIS